MVNAMRVKNWSKRFGFPVMPRGELDGKFAGGQERLLVGLAAAQGVTAHHARGHAQFAAHQAVRPVALDEDCFSEQGNASLCVGAPQEDDERLLRRVWDAARRGVARRCSVLLGGMALSVRGDVGAGTLLQGAQMRMPPADPDLLLPEVVEAFDVGLEAGFARRRKDRDDAQTQTEVNHPAQMVGMGVRPLEAGVVVELGEVWVSVSAPVFGEGGEDIVGGEAGAGPALGQPAVQRQGIEHIQERTVFNDQAFHEIEGVEFGAAVGDGGQIPAGGGRRAALATGAGKAGAGDEAGQRAGRGGGQVPGEEFAAQCCGSVFAEGRMTFELEAQRQDAAEELAGGAVFGSGVTARAVGKVRAEKALAFGAMKPFVSGAGADAEAGGDCAEGGTAPERRNDAAAFDEQGSFDMETESGAGRSGRQAIAPPAALRLRSGSLRSPPLRRNAAGAPASHVISVYHLLSLDRLPFPVTCPIKSKITIKIENP